MIAYVGQTRAEKWIQKCNDVGFREMTNLGESPPRRVPFALDNGAYKNWKAGKPWNEKKFLRDLEKCSHLSPDFVVLPDRVAKGVESLSFSMTWVPKLRGVAPLYLALQDGMERKDVLPFVGQVDGFFLGGTTPWKFQMGESWTRFAHEHGKPMHIGRAGTETKVYWARRIGADSLDSCYPLWSQEQFDAFVEALIGPIPQTPFGW